MNNMDYYNYFSFPYNRNQSVNNEYYKHYYNHEDYLSFNNTRSDSFYTPNEGFSKGNIQANIYESYKLKNPNLPLANSEREKLLLEVQKLDFAIWDLNLYLNTHPTDRNAMMMFAKYQSLYKQAKQEYESKYGALEVCNVSTEEGYWDWNKNPWPWEVK